MMFDGRQMCGASYSQMELWSRTSCMEIHSTLALSGGVSNAIPDINISTVQGMWSQHNGVPAHF